MERAGTCDSSVAEIDVLSCTGIMLRSFLADCQIDEYHQVWIGKVSLPLAARFISFFFRKFVEK